MVRAYQEFRGEWARKSGEMKKGGSEEGLRTIYALPPLPISTNTQHPMRIEENCIVTMNYELREHDHQGQVMEVMDIAYPFIFFYKSDNLLESFQENIRGLQRGDAFEFILPSQRAYGAPRPDQVVEIPIERFVIDDELADSIRDVGQYVSVTDDDGHRQNGKVVEKTAMHLKVDLNHAMAGKDLHFRGNILRVRAASVDEIVQQRYIMPDGIRF